MKFLKRAFGGLLLIVILGGIVVFAAQSGLLDRVPGISDVKNVVQHIVDGRGAGNALPARVQSFTGETVKLRVNGRSLEVHASLVTAMDEYEQYFDDYIRAMKSENPLEIARFYSQFITTMEAIEDTELSDADSVYYLYRLNRINEKLMMAGLE